MDDPAQSDTSVRDLQHDCRGVIQSGLEICFAPAKHIQNHEGVRS
jgi:hypothetical protein